MDENGSVYIHRGLSQFSTARQAFLPKPTFSPRKWDCPLCTAQAVVSDGAATGGDAGLLV